MSKVLYLTDRSACETDDDCGQKYWWNRKHGRRGIVSVDESFYLTIGKETHEDLAMVAEMPDISPEALDKVIAPLLDSLQAEDISRQTSMEALYRRLGWLVAFGLYIEPGIRATYEPVQLEDEIVLDRTPLWVAVTPDRVLRHRETGRLIYREYKTTITAGKKWEDSWPYSVQLHVGLKAIEEELDEQLAYAQIMGLMKGNTYNSDGRLTHPYVWAWFNEGAGIWSNEYQRSTGWAPRPVWEYPGGLVEWVQLCGPGVAAQQFPHSRPIVLNEHIVNDFVASRLHREREIADVTLQCHISETERAKYFRKKMKTCRPAWGDACPYLSACWNATIGQDPLKSGLFVERTPHHEVEVVFEQEMKSGKTS